MEKKILSEENFYKEVGFMKKVYKNIPNSLHTIVDSRGNEITLNFKKKLMEGGSYKNTEHQKEFLRWLKNFSNLNSKKEKIDGDNRNRQEDV